MSGLPPFLPLRDAQFVGGSKDGARMKVAGDLWRFKFQEPGLSGRPVIEWYEVRGEQIVFLYAHGADGDAAISAGAAEEATVISLPTRRHWRGRFAMHGPVGRGTEAGR
ncbi:MAG TPA: hypothetical protein VME70_08180 [Mycobacteriales bacterium]|nr:hypothetical protein [Mycobacteriales bacterium]